MLCNVRPDGLHNFPYSSFITLLMLAELSWQAFVNAAMKEKRSQCLIGRRSCSSVWVLSSQLNKNNGGQWRETPNRFDIVWVFPQSRSTSLTVILFDIEWKELQKYCSSPTNGELFYWNPRAPNSVADFEKAALVIIPFEQINFTKKKSRFFSHFVIFPNVLIMQTVMSPHGNSSVT